MASFSVTSVIGSLEVEHIKNDEVVTDICSDTICDLAFSEEKLQLLVESVKHVLRRNNISSQIQL